MRIVLTHCPWHQPPLDTGWRWAVRRLGVRFTSRICLRCLYWLRWHGKHDREAGSLAGRLKQVEAQLRAAAGETRPAPRSGRS